MLIARRLIIVLEVVVGVLALAGGIALIIQPSGALLHFSPAMLHGVLHTFEWPGLVLLAMSALFFVAAWATHRRYLWDHVVSTAAGAVLILWISVQVVLIGFHDWSQAVFFLVGTAIFYLATELWREGEGPHMGMVDGYEGLALKNTSAVDSSWRTSDRFRFLQLILRRRRS
jgi:hypothetical protein